MPRWLASGYLALVRWAFNRFYREFAWSYDSVAWIVSRGLWRRWALAALPYVKGRVLELGCGTGYVQHALATQHRASVVGVDASPQMLRLTRRRTDRSNLHVALTRALAQALPFPTRRFHSVVATFPSEYILHPATLAEIQRVLADDGQLVLVDAAHFTHDGLYERLVDLAYRVTFQTPVRTTSIQPPHLQRLEQAGFRMTTTWETVGPSQVMVLIGKKAHAYAPPQT